MKIVFGFTSNTRLMTEKNWGKVPMGGAEISAINLGEELLKLNCDVTYFLRRAEPFDRFDLHVRRHDQARDNIDVDCFIWVRPHPGLQKNLPNVSKKLLWSGDAFDQPSNDIFLNKEVAQSLDAFVFKSSWQRAKIVEKYPYINPNKAHVIYNGIKEGHYRDIEDIEPQKNRFIHASTWYRGVKNFVYIWPRIFERLPDAELHIFSNTSLYSDLIGKEDGWTPIAEELSRMPGIILREPVPQSILTREIRKAWLMLYPNTGFVESSCGTALQSISAGTPVVATKRAGLPETVCDAGILVEERDGWQDEFIEKTVELSRKNEKRERLAAIGRRNAESQYWQLRAREWVDFLKCL